MIIKLSQFVFSFLLLTMAALVHAEVDVAIQSGVLTPAAVRSGEMTTSSLTVANHGTEAVYSSVAFYLSPDAELNNGDTYLGSTAASLAAGEIRDITKSLTIPAVVATGTYYVIAFIDYRGDYAEPNESNNQHAMALPVEGTACNADSAEQDDSAATATPAVKNRIAEHNHCDDPQDWLKFTAVQGERFGFQNLALSYGHETTLKVYAEDGLSLLAEAQIPIFGTDNPKLIWTAPATGTYLLQSLAEAGFSGVGPNTSYQSIIADPVPDLVLSEMASTVCPESGCLAAGDAVRVYNSIRNDGFTAAQNFEVGIYLSTDNIITRDDVRIGYRRVENLPSNGEGNFDYTMVSIPPDTPYGDYYIGAIVDDGDVVQEYQENNNISLKPATTKIKAPACAPDSYEVDDMDYLAKPIVLDQPQLHNHCDDDYDWVYFDATGGVEYVVRAVDEAGRPKSGKHLLIYDDAGQQLVTRDGVVRWTAPATGRYHILASAVANGAGDIGPYYLGVVRPTADLYTTAASHVNIWSVPRGGVIDSYNLGVKNIGYQDAVASLMGFYLSTDNLITAGDLMIDTYDLPALAVGQSYFDNSQGVILIPAETAPGVYYFGAIADIDAVNDEFDRSNNAYKPNGHGLLEIVPPACPPDPFEPDERPAMAKPISEGVVQEHNFCEDGWDWLQFQASAGRTYTFRVDTAYGSIYDVGGVQQLAVSEALDAVGPQPRWVSYTAETSGTYLLRMRPVPEHYTSSAYHDNSDYRVNFSSCLVDAYESDDSGATATLLGLDEVQHHNHCDDGTDWLEVRVPAAGKYIIETTVLDAGADTLLTLYEAPDSFFSLAWSDNISKKDPGSRISYDFPAAGSYYVKVSGYHRGAGSAYTVTFKRGKGR